MEAHKEGNRHLDELFNTARQEKPLLNLDEVKNILPATPASFVPPSKGFRFSISHIIVGSGIVISSGLAYFTMKTDKPIVADNHKTELTVQKAPTIINPSKEEIKPAATIQSSSEKNNAPLASTDKKLITLPETKYKKVNLNESNVASQKFTVTPDFHFDGRHYKITIVGTDVTAMEVDDVKISSDQFAQHAGAIGVAKGLVEARIKEEGDKQSLMNFIDKNLRTDKLAGDENNYVFLLTADHLYIDGMPQDEKEFIRYSNFYKQQTGKEVAKGDEYQFKMQRKQLVNKDVYGFKTK